MTITPGEIKAMREEWNGLQSGICTAAEQAYFARKYLTRCLDEIERLNAILEVADEGLGGLYIRACKTILKLESIIKKAEEIGSRFLNASLAGAIRYTDGVGFEFQEFLKDLKKSTEGA